MGTNASYMLPHYLNKYHDVTVISPKPREKEKNLVVFTDKNLKRITINNGGIKDRATEASAHIHEIQPDIVHVFSHPRCILYPLIYKKWKPKSKIKWYLDIRSHIFGKDGWDLFKERLGNGVYQFQYDYISATASKSYNSYVMCPVRPFTWVPIGTDLTEFEKVPKKSRYPSKFVFVGSIARVRKLHILIEGFGKFLDTVKDPKFKFDLYGDGNSMEELEELVKHGGWQKQIKFHGKLAFNKLAKVMSSYDAGFVFLPKDKFSYAPALKRLEYAAARIDILESNTLWNVENPENFERFLFENSPESIKNTLIEYTTQKTSVSRLDHNYEMVKRYDWQNIIQNDVAPIYDRLAANSGN